MIALNNNKEKSNSMCAILTTMNDDGRSFLQNEGYITFCLCFLLQNVGFLYVNQQKEKTNKPAFMTREPFSFADGTPSKALLVWQSGLTNSKSHLFQW